MTETVIVSTNASDASSAAQEISGKVLEGLGGSTPDALLLFAAPHHDQPALLRAVASGCSPKVMVGASSSGEFTQERRGEGLVCAMAIRSDDIEFNVGIAQGLRGDREDAARSAVRSFRGVKEHPFPFRSAFVMTDGLAGHAEDFVHALREATGGKYQLFGGGAGDNARFQHTPVFHGTEVLTDAAVVLEILSRKPVGIGVAHGWEPRTPAMRVTETRGQLLLSLNGTPAQDVFADYAAESGQDFDPETPLPFFLNNILGIEMESGHRLRCPLGIGESGSILCATEVPVGSKVAIMGTSHEATARAVSIATEAALAALRGHRPQAALFFDCVATRLRMGDAFDDSLGALRTSLDPTAGYVGCNTHGQISRFDGELGGFHNCTAIVCVLPA